MTAATSILAFGFLAMAALAPAALADEHDQRRLTVIGRGEVSAVPDIATLSIGVETEAKTPSEALSENASRMNKVMARLKEAGIADKDLQTSQLNIWPVYAERSSSDYQQRVTGYRAGNQLNVTLRDIERIGEILDQAVADGANSVHGPTFAVADPAPLLEKAQEAAIKDAMAKAERYAAAAGVKLRKIIRIDEASSGGGPDFGVRMRAESMAASTPVAAGETTFSQDVTMVFAIR